MKASRELIPEGKFSTRPGGGRVKDARGRSVSLVDPVRLHILNLQSIIPAETLRSMADQIMPGARRQRLILLLIAAFTLLFVVGGTVIYFRYFSVWKGFDPISTTIHVIQVLAILAGPVVGFRVARSKYSGRIASVVLAHRRCPHCGYDLRGLETDPGDGATLCPECGCAWRMDTQERSKRGGHD